MSIYAASVRLGLLGAVMQGLRNSTDAGEVINLITRYSDDDNDDVRWRLPEGMTPREYYQHLVHRGALHEHRDFSVACPIPSFSDWMIRNACARMTRVTTATSSRTT
ncbi:MAG: hypothetical protein F4186_02580 [Boseongicola sp. SB0676_bin_33]|nr:hypothetical protein [Boseongicola sp. SB0676_bin_33]MYK32170.1 hypothetical protein [Boseongicola sp. SB0670_bin_30]